ncbi:hypothetical protein M446_0102 [Methylobacterium sp. 4-46]|uniref:thiopeptide-type bacteriocin biosynthesis protein n=1 Tax=unclassified Methylobacterium TaxID=2615210 RepID=UPI000152E168|nr:MULTISPECIES: thiopeptide-type bacteriocin biosynthesis protein [Methylobacterium]ACA14687.1 hypothetical protein M446_0102 [Methylobacterium sp. 4-46]WFT80440.1 thiopeptide-type bacteriocin biosynthesis protein [Methylobacterium nodulans]
MARAGRSWLQVNVGLSRERGSALPAARALLGEIGDALPGWRRTRLLSAFLFQRKPPDLRLRFRGDRDRLLAELRPILARHVAEGRVTRHFVSVYEPEARLFGGAQAMEAVHGFWEADSRLWIAVDRLIAEKALTIPYPSLLTAILNETAWRSLGDGAEVWDTWCNLLVLLRAPAEGAPAGDAPPLPASPPIHLDGLRTSAGPAEAAILDAYGEAAGQLAAGLLRSWERGRLACGLRALLATAALFTLNRHGFGQARAVPLVRAVAASWDGRSLLRGALPEPHPGAFHPARHPDRGAIRQGAG